MLPHKPRFVITPVVFPNVLLEFLLENPRGFPQNFLHPFPGKTSPSLSTIIKSPAKLHVFRIFPWILPWFSPCLTHFPHFSHDPPGRPGSSSASSPRAPSGAAPPVPARRGGPGTRPGPAAGCLAGQLRAFHGVPIEGIPKYMVNMRYGEFMVNLWWIYDG